MKLAIIGEKHPLRESLVEQLGIWNSDVEAVTPAEFEKLPYRSELPKVNFNKKPQLVELRLSYIEQRKNKLVLSTIREQSGTK